MQVLVLRIGNIIICFQGSDGETDNIGTVSVKKWASTIQPIFLFCLLGISLPDGCQFRHEVEVEGISKRPMAKATIESFLGGLRTEDFTKAATHFAGPLEVLWMETTGLDNKLSDGAPVQKPDLKNMSLSAKADLLAAYVAKHPGCCRDYTIGAEKMIEPYHFTISVEFRQWPHDPEVVEFQISYDKSQYWVLGLPPKFTD